MGSIIFLNTMTLQVGYKVMSLNTGKPLTILKNTIHELTLPDNLIDRVEQLA